MRALCAEKRAIGPESHSIAAGYSRSPTKNPRIASRAQSFPIPGGLWTKERGGRLAKPHEQIPRAAATSSREL